MFKSLPLRLSALFLLAAGLLCGCAVRQPVSQSEAFGAESLELHISPEEHFRFSMGGKQLSLPGPRGGVIKSVSDPVRQAAGGWLLPPENIFCVYENPGTFKLRGGKTAVKSGGSAPLRHRTVIIISALPEFMDESVSSGQLKALRADLIRTSGLWREDAAGEFLRLTGSYYKGRAGFTHSLGVYHSTACSVSDARIVKEADLQAARKPGAAPTGAGGGAPGPDDIWASMNPLDDLAGTGAVSGSGGTVLGDSGWPRIEPDRLSDELRRYFSGGHYTLSIRNLLCLRGKVFNIYFNTPLQSLEDIRFAMEENARYMGQIAKQAAAGDKEVSGLSGLSGLPGELAPLHEETEEAPPLPDNPAYRLSDPIA